MFEIIESQTQNTLIKVIGVGGGGGNAVDQMVKSNIEGVEFICANTDAQVLKNATAQTILQIGTDLTKGLGAGGNPKIGQQAALEDRERILATLEGAEMLFITAGMGGGTGTGAAPVIAQIAKELEILTVGVITRPFPFEGMQRATIADAGIKELMQHVDALIIIPNEKLLNTLDQNISILDAFKAANDILHNAVKGIIEIITFTGLINLDLSDVRTIMQHHGLAMMGTGYGKGEGCARQACLSAISTPLLEDSDLSSARGILANIIAGKHVNIHEFNEMGNALKEFTSSKATIIIGTGLDPDMEEGMRVTILATGLDSTHSHAAPATPIPVQNVPISNRQSPPHTTQYLNVANFLNR
ncbi:MAG: cell division protein FtsZ [Thiomargarita sp.]|nr:cell division protein FtsZ [Thiomargarita sp.]